MQPCCNIHKLSGHHRGGRLPTADSTHTECRSSSLLFLPPRIMADEQMNATSVFSQPTPVIITSWRRHVMASWKEIGSQCPPDPYIQQSDSYDETLQRILLLKNPNLGTSPEVGLALLPVLRAIHSLFLSA